MTIAIRLVNASDASAIQAIYAPYVRDTSISLELDPPDVETMRQRIVALLPTHPWLVCEKDGEVIGYAYGSQHAERLGYQWSVNMTVYVVAGLHRSGVGRALYTSLIELLRRQGFVSAYAGIGLPNSASVGLHQSLGFSPVGIYNNVAYKLGQWQQVMWLWRALQTPMDAPTAPLSLDALCEHPEWDAALSAGLTYLRI